MAIDHTTIRPGGPGNEHFPKGTDRMWWTKSAKEAPDSISAALSLLEEQEKLRGTTLVRGMRMYGSTSVTAGFPGMGAGTTTSTGGPSQFRDRLSFNVVQIVTDAITSKMAKNKPRPFYLTSGGDWGERRRAKRLNRYTDGVFYENKIPALATLAFRDCCVQDAGVIHVYAKNGRVACERVPSAEIKVDELEGCYGFPRSLHRPKLVDRQVLAAAFPEHKKLIEDAAGAWAQEAVAARPHISDLVLVRESWHLPSKPDAKDGKHIITIAEGPLTPMEDWPHEFFPFAFLRWSPKLVGFWGQSLAEQLAPIQLEINKLLFLVQRSYHLAGSFKILMEMGSKVAPEHMNNEVGAIIKYQGVEPKYVVPPILPPEIYQHLQFLIGKAFETGRISQLSAVGEKPAGLNSGEAQRVYHDIESDGFQTIGKAYEQFHVDLADITRAVTLDIMQTSGKKTYETRAVRARWLESVKVEKKDLETDDFVVQCFPVSSLPQEPAGRMSTIQEWVQAGWIDQSVGKKLMQFPDIEAEESLTTACEDYLEKILDAMVDAEEDYVQVQPEPYDNPAQAFELAHQFYLAGKRDGLEEPKLERLRVFMDACRALMQAAAAPAANTNTAQGGAPQAAPEPPPTSPLIPNAPGAAA